MGKSGKKWALGAVVAGVGGYLAGILTAPKSGKDTRKEIKTNAVKLKSEAEKKLKQVHSELNSVLAEAKVKGAKLTGKAKNEFEEAVKKATNAKEKARELLSALHDGDADDPELKVAVENGKSALQHLKKFIKTV